MGSYSVVDLFCGIGGLTHGFINEKFKVMAGYDIDPSCEYAYEVNNINSFFKCCPIESVSGEEIANLYPSGEPKILTGCTPCQPYSSYTNNQAVNKKKWNLLFEFSRLIKQIKPDIVSMENVSRLSSFKGGTILKRFVTDLEDQGYTVSKFNVYCPEFGIPQSRTRLVLLASKFGFINLIEPTHTPDNYTTVRDTISHLPPLDDGMAHSTDRLHLSSSLSPLNLRRIRASRPGGTWRDWPEDLIADCHLKKSGHSYKNVYGRMEWDKPSPTITTQCCGFGNGRFGHPEQDRAISIREAALLQTFPPSFKFVSPENNVKIKTLSRHIGNAVPVKLGQVIARSVMRHLESNNGPKTI